MHEAYEAHQLLKLTVQIESLAAYGKYTTLVEVKSVANES